MRSLPLHYYPESEILVNPAKPVNDFSEPEVYNILTEWMYKTMHANRGIGLAAPQIGMSLRIFIAAEDNSYAAYFNPVIVDQSSKLVTDEEGCLSLPGFNGLVTRPEKVTVDYQDMRGKHHVRDFNGLRARVVQHEIDHLDGWLFPFYYIPGAKKGEFKPLTWSLLDELTNNYLEFHGSR